MVWMLFWGRRQYNSWRRFKASYRRLQVSRLALQLQGTGRGLIGSYGIQSKIAERLGVSRSTVSRDFKAFKAFSRERKKCPVCGSEVVGEFSRLLELIHERAEDGEGYERE